MYVYLVPLCCMQLTFLLPQLGFTQGKFRHGGGAGVNLYKTFINIASQHENHISNVTCVVLFMFNELPR